jgi:plant G-box-binding factor
MEDIFYQYAGCSQNMQGVVNQAMLMTPIQPGAAIGVPDSTINLNIGMDYWATPGSVAVSAMHSEAPAGSARRDQWV